MLILAEQNFSKTVHLKRILVDTHGRFACRLRLGPWPRSHLLLESALFGLQPRIDDCVSIYPAQS